MCPHDRDTSGQHDVLNFMTVNNHHSLVCHADAYRHLSLNHRESRPWHEALALCLAYKRQKVLSLALMRTTKEFIHHQHNENNYRGHAWSSASASTIDITNWAKEIISPPKIKAHAVKLRYLCHKTYKCLRRPNLCFV